MSVWLTIPSKRPPSEANEILHLWQERGYKIALMREIEDTSYDLICDVQIVSPPDGYPGYARAVNYLSWEILDPDANSHDPDAEWFVLGGDDIEPDPNHSAEEISGDCRSYFDDLWSVRRNDGNVMYAPPDPANDETFGVMQPTGDQWGDKDGPYIQRVCGSPWIGREFARRINQGRGPLWPEYFHMGSDEELQAVAVKYGVLWQRPDLTHFHRHWGRPRQGEKMGMADRMPDFLKRANSPEEWRKYKKLFAERQAAGFPGSDPIA